MGSLSGISVVLVERTFFLNLIKMAFAGCFGFWKVLADGSRCESWPSLEKPSFNSVDPCGRDRAESGGKNKLHQFWDGLFLIGMIDEILAILVIGDYCWFWSWLIV
jgi:hypothetical protein